MPERIPVTAMVGDDKIVLGFLQMGETIKSPGIVDRMDGILDLGNRRFRVTIAGAPWNVCTLHEEM